jgi:hypothetical protein
VTRALHRFGLAAHRSAASWAFACSVLDQTVKTKHLQTVKSLIQNDFLTWHAPCVGPCDPATGASA